MIKVLDTFVPSLCIVLATAFIATAIYLHAETALQNTNTTTQQQEIVLEQQVSSNDLRERFSSINKNTATVINSFTEERKRQGKIKILLVPGHDFEYPGAIFKKTKESELTLSTAHYLQELLETVPQFEVYVTREKILENTPVGDVNDYTKIFQDYFVANKDAVLDYKNIYKEKTEKIETQKQIEPVNHVEHNDAPSEVAYRLYAINKWIEDNKIDIVIHIHFNDYPGRPKNWGKYNGFSIYVPDEHLRNGIVSQDFAKFIGNSLDQKFDYSNHPVEKLGIISGSDLIATGAYNTIQAAAILVEYGYVYEPDFQKEETFKKMAEQTFAGIMNYFEEPL